MATLDPRIEEVRKTYKLQNDDFWQIPQNKQWVIKHRALEQVSMQAGIRWGKVTVIEADSANGIAVMMVVGQRPVPGSDEVMEEWSTGEASPKNNKNSYPWAMAEKRAKDRVILKLVGLHGLLYSEEELDNSPKTSAHKKRQLEKIANELNDAHTLVQLDKLKKEWWAVMKQEKWDQSYIEIAGNYFGQREEELKNA